MKRGLYAVLLGCIVLSACSKKESTAAHDAAVDSLSRARITFILGKDENPRNPYYSLADDYYRLNDSEKTEIVIDTISSLSGVLHYLAHNRPANGRPWGLINLVSHGNEFIDLSVRITPYGARVSEESLKQALADTVLTPLDTTLIDARTLVNLHGCAVGKNLALLRMLGAAFGRTPPHVKASKMFEYYGNTSVDNNPQFVKHYYARAWYAFYHPDSLVSDSMLAVQFRYRYPAAEVNWDEAVRRYRPNNPSEEYNMRMIIPVAWEDFYETRQQMPDVRAKSRQDAWVQNKPEFKALLDRTGIPKECFQIKFYSSVYTSDTTKYYSLKAKGRACVACVVKPVLKNDAADFPPYIPAQNDTEFFGFAAR